MSFEFEFEITEKDYVAFNLFHVFHSRSLKQQVLIPQIIIGLVIFGCVAGTFFESYPIPAFIFAAIFGGTAFLAVPYLHKQNLTSQVQRMLKEGSNKSLLGRYLIRVSPDGIYYKTITIEVKVSWLGVERVAQNEGYVFVYIGATQAIIIPKNAFYSDLQQNEFIGYINSNINQVSS